MSDNPIGDPGRPMEQSFDDLTKTMTQLSVTTGNSDNASLSSKNLSDMPFDVVGMIIDRSDYKQQLILRKVSKSLRALVDKQKPACRKIRVECHTKCIKITFNYHFVVYTDDEFFESPSIKVTSDFEKAAFNDLASTLINPKLQLEEFMIKDWYSEKEESKKYCKEIQRILESLNRELFVKRFEIMLPSSSWLFSTLPHLKPGVLESISLIPVSGVLTGMDKVALLEQWKQAKEFEMGYTVHAFPMEYATHFKRFRFNEASIDEDEFIHFKDFLCKSNNLEKCTLWNDLFYFNHNLVYELLGEPVSSNTTEEVFHYSIPDSDYYLEFKKAPGSLELEITKKKRESK